MSTKVVVVYHSATGTTGKLAHSVIEGVSAVQGVDAQLIEILGQDIHQGVYVNEKTIASIDAAKGVIFGSPTFMGSVSAQFKAFADATGDLWVENRWSGKIAAGFTVGSNFSGDQLSTLQYFAILAAQHGMLWCGVDIPGGFDDRGLNRLGAQGGLVAQTSDDSVDPADLATASYLGQRVANFCQQLKT